jgi:hypothetical protein
MTDAAGFEAAPGSGAPHRDGADTRGHPAAGRGVFVLDSDGWAALSRLLEPPVRDVAGLRRLLSRATILP